MLRIGTLRCSPGRAQPELASLKHPAASPRPDSAARRYAQGTRIQTGSLTLRKQDRFAILVGIRRRRVRPERSHWPRLLHGSSFSDWRRGAAPVLGPVWSDEKRRAEGCPAHCAGADSCLRIAKAIRVLAASLRTEHRSEPAHFAPARNPGVFSLGYFSLDKQREVTRTAVRNKRSGELVSRSKNSRPEASPSKATAQTKCSRVVHLPRTIARQRQSHHA
jgi:hypothetical protein